MNREVVYVLRGFLLALVVFAGVCMTMVLGLPSFASLTEEKEIIFLCGTSSASVVSSSNPMSYKGQQLFQDNCAPCHQLYKDMTGPALAGIEKRITDQKLLRRWIRNNTEVLKSGNVYFNELYKKWNKTSMTVFPSFTDDEIDAILAYTREYKLSRQF